MKKRVLATFLSMAMVLLQAVEHQVVESQTVILLMEKYSVML